MRVINPSTNSVADCQIVAKGNAWIVAVFQQIPAMSG